MILGIGVDIVSVARVQCVWNTWGERFVKRILHPEEMGRYREKRESIVYLASRFAAKEAVSKALGTGIGRVAFTDIVIVPVVKGKPCVRLCGYAGMVGEQLGIKNIFLSISHEKEYAVAYVTMTGV